MPDSILGADQKGKKDYGLWERDWVNLCCPEAERTNSIYVIQNVILIGFLNKEIEKADIHITDTGENPEAPQPREMIDLEVGKHYNNCFVVTWQINFLVADLHVSRHQWAL